MKSSSFVRRSSAVLTAFFLFAFHPFARATTYYVAPGGNNGAGTNWATAKQTIQAAIDLSTAGDTILVTNRIYATGGRVSGVAGQLLTNRVVIDKAVTVRSVNGPGVTTIRGAKDPLTTNGNAAVRCVWATTNATLSGFTLTNGATRTSGGADLDGGGVYAKSAAVSVSNCVFTGNSADEDGGGTYGGTVNNCWFIGNRGGYGGGAGFFENPGTLNNCTLSGNSAVVGGGSVAGTLNNCIVYFNTAPSGNNYSGGTCSYSCSTPLPAGTDNITNDPMFVSLATTNLHLAAGSPCRDTGNNANAPGTTDFEGNPRIVNAVVDMGAYENQSVPSPDYDGDGMPNASETIAGSGALDSNDVWKITSLTVTNPAAISFPTVAGRIYAADYNANLAATPQVWIEFTNNIPGTGNPIIIETPIVTNRNFRIRVQLAP